MGCTSVKNLGNYFKPKYRKENIQTIGDYEDNGDMEKNYIYMQDDKVITNDVAKEAMLNFLKEEIGPFVKFGFENERKKLEEKINTEIDTLKNYISTKLDDATSDIVRTLKSKNMLKNVTDNVEKEAIKIVNDKLKIAFNNNNIKIDNEDECS